MPASWYHCSVFITCYGFVVPNTTALAMAPHGQVAGSASALLGTIQFVLASITGALVGALANGTAIPLAASDRRMWRGGVHHPPRCRYAISSVTVSGLSSVATHTTLVTNCGIASNSSARIVVITAVGIDDCSTPA